MAKIYTSQNWRIICDTQEDQTSATGLKILAKSPKGVKYSFDATLDTNTNRIYYDVAVGEIAEAGDWHIWPKTTISGNVAPGDAAKVTIYEEGT